MKKKLQKLRALAVQRYLTGEVPKAYALHWGKLNRGCING